MPPPREPPKLEAPRELLARAALWLEAPENALLFLEPMLPLDVWRLPMRSPPPPQFEVGADVPLLPPGPPLLKPLPAPPKFA